MRNEKFYLYRNLREDQVGKYKPYENNTRGRNNQNNLGRQLSNKTITETHRNSNPIRPPKRTLEQSEQENITLKPISIYNLNQHTSTLIEAIREEVNFKGFTYEEGKIRGHTSLIIYNCKECTFSACTLKTATKHKHWFRMKLSVPGTAEIKGEGRETIEVGVIPMIKLTREQLENEETNHQLEGNGRIQAIVCPVCHNEIRGKNIRAHLLEHVRIVQRKFEPIKGPLPTELTKENNIVKLIFSIYRQIRSYEISGTNNDISSEEEMEVEKTPRM